MAVELPVVNEKVDRLRNDFDGHVRTDGDIHSDTGTPISTQPVDSGTATLEVTATTPGVIRIQAGDGAGPGNEVEIVAN